MINSDIELKYIAYNDEAELEPEDRALIDDAKKASESSYSPYSNFEVGAALLLETGEVVRGSNQENSSYPCGSCAEQVALFHSGANHKDVVIKKIAVTAKKKGGSAFLPVTPCGSCRQVMLEYQIKQNLPIEILMQVSANKWIKVSSVEVLLPFCFNKNAL
ncbi:Cytidine deaminase [Fulvivirga imtechensis AK7]|uniref:Cytidine deaminase n=1 Tax=Fulvivirga imtechensis AK7 TaxID=1237149 RepID=L8JNJ7_9BACT|nr:cytidine deaminase [Fulvivirga imtechensis]ELR70410.1 Cytidine deaminase [Fulvivirga imtechensis AK7]